MEVTLGKIQSQRIFSFRGDPQEQKQPVLGDTLKTLQAHVSKFPSRHLQVHTPRPTEALITCCGGGSWWFPASAQPPGLFNPRADPGPVLAKGLTHRNTRLGLSSANIVWIHGPWSSTSTLKTESFQSWLQLQATPKLKHSQGISEITGDGLSSCKSSSGSKCPALPRSCLEGISSAPTWGSALGCKARLVLLTKVSANWHVIWKMGKKINAASLSTNQMVKY